MITWVKKVNNFQIAKVQSQGGSYSSCLIFSRYQPTVTYESVAHKKACTS